MSTTLAKKSTIKINNNLSFYSQVISTETKKVNIATDHFFIVDCSGSMYSDLKKVKQHLKNKLPTSVKDNDTITIIYFSGKGEFGVLQEFIEIKSIKDFTQLNKVIDKLDTIGLTAFKEPLDEVYNIITKRQVKDRAYSIIFMTDGYDNCWSEKEILNSVSRLKPLVSNAVFVEYGHYANKELLFKMAEEIGGTSIFAENFYTYEPIFEKAIQSTGTLSKKEVTLDKIPSSSLVYTIKDNNIISFKIEEDNKVLVPEDTVCLYYFTNDVTKEKEIKATDLEKNSLIGLTASLYILSQKAQSKTIYSILEYLGDVSLIKKYSKAIGKQAITNFESDIVAIVNDSSLLFKEGYDPSFMPDPNEYCLLDLLEDLSKSKENRIYVNHPDWEYNKISLGTKQKSNLSAEDQEKLKVLNEKYNNESNVPDKVALQEQIDEIKAKDFKLKTEYDKFQSYSFSNFVLNEKRPNINVSATRNIKITGFPKNQWDITEWDSFDTKNYNLVVDGIKNVKNIFVSLSKDMFLKLKNLKLLNNPPKIYNPKLIYEIDLTDIGVVNRALTINITAEETAKDQWKLMKLKAAKKVFDHYLKALAYDDGKFNKKLFESKEQADWLESLGISESGFNPEKESVESVDNYPSVELNIAIASLSAIGKVEDAAKKYEESKTADPAKFKCNLNLFIMFDYIKQYDDFINSSVYTNSNNKEKTLNQWLENSLDSVKEMKNELMNQMSKRKFSLIMSQSWFSDLLSRNDKELTLTLDNREVKFTMDLTSKSVKK